MKKIWGQERIKELKKERNAIILAHLYQRPEVQDIADFTGDSLDLSRKAIATNADIIIFCGVRFMAETAYILNPNKIILLPEKDAGCPLADMAEVEQLKKKKSQYPNAAVVSYVNSSAALKAESDICCTSANAVDVVNSLPQKQVLFLPDRNLGSYVAEKTDKEIILWPGYCYVHEKNINTNKLRDLKQRYQNARIMIHPECNPEVIGLADYIGSTSQMLKYAEKSEAKEFIVGTEDGLIHRLQKENPNKKFYPFNTVCKDMKITDLKSIVTALEKMRYKISIPDNICIKAKRALDKMLELKI